MLVTYCCILYIASLFGLSRAFILPMFKSKFIVQTLDALVRDAIDDTQFAQIISSEKTRFIPILNGKNFATKVPNSDTYTPVFLNSHDMIQFSESKQADPSTSSTSTAAVSYYFLGSHTEPGTEVATAYVVANISTSAPLSATLQSPDTKCDMLRFFADQLDPFHQGLLTHARGLAVWHDSCNFCSKCGSRTLLHRQGGGRKCSSSACKMSHYPRLEPAVIMAITSQCNNFLLLGRKKEWPKGRYSTLAGFLEIGETLEDAVIRETWEESGIMVNKNRISYFQSQPWPFPSSFMLGFFGSALEPGLPAISVDTNEMEDVRWFSREQVVSALSSTGRAVSWEPDAVTETPLHFPGRSSLARKLIENWAAPSSV